MTLHLTRDEWARIAAEGEGVLFRPSVRRPGTDSGSWEMAEHPPAEFVEAAKPCEWCHGAGWKNAGGWDPTPCDNPDCLGGKRRIAFVVPCKGCRAGYWEEHGCDGAGGMVLTVGHVVVEWGPLVVVGNERTARPAEYLWLPGDGTLQHAVIGRMPMFDNWTHLLPPDVDPQSLVGQYAIGIKVVEP